MTCVPTCVFPLADVLDLVEEVLPTTDHTDPVRQPHGPALWWTVDDGVFLTATASGTTRVHARGFGPGTAWTDLALAGLDAIGPQPIALTGRSGEALAGHLREAAAHHQPWALLRLRPGHAAHHIALAWTRDVLCDTIALLTDVTDGDPDGPDEHNLRRLREHHRALTRALDTGRERFRRACADLADTRTGLLWPRADPAPATPPEPPATTSAVPG